MSNETIPTQPFHVDGGLSILDSVIEDLNILVSGLPKRLMYVSDDIGLTAVHVEHNNADSEHVGSATHTGATEGTVTIACSSGDESIPGPAHVMAFRDQYLVVSGNVAPKREKGKAVQVSLPVKRIVNPVLSDLLSVKGQVKDLAITTLAPMTSLTLTVVNKRAGSTGVFSSIGLPAGIVLNPSTGAVTGTATLAGVYTSRIIYTESLTNEEDHKGLGWLRFTVT